MTPTQLSLLNQNLGNFFSQETCFLSIDYISTVCNKYDEGTQIDE